MNREAERMANSYEKVLSVISKKPSQRQDFEIQSLLPWLRKKANLFRALKTDYLKDIVRNCSTISYKKDDIVIKQGERGDCFYIILAGSVSIFIINKDKDGSGGDERAAFAEIGAMDKDGNLDRSRLGNFATTLGSGNPFGEVALMSEDCIRTATIIAEEQTDLLVVDRSLYNRCVNTVLEAEFQEKRDFIKHNPLFKTWMPKYKKQLAMAMYKETLQYDSVLVRQGETVTNIYYVISGQVEIRTDPLFHPVQFPQFYKLLEDEREKLIKEKKHRPRPQEIETVSNVKKRDNSKSLKLCYLGINESLGEIEVLLDMGTYMQTAVCAEKTEVLVLEMKHYERLFVRRHQKSIDEMRHNLELKLNTKSSVLSAKENDDVPLLGLINMKLNLLHNPPKEPAEKKKKETSVKGAEKLFFHPKGPLLDADGPGSVFYMIRIREKSKLKLKAHQKDGLKSNKQQSGHMHTIRLPRTLVMAAQIAGAKETKDEEADREPISEIELVGQVNTPQHLEMTDNKISSEKQIVLMQKHSPRSFRRIQSAIKPNYLVSEDEDIEDRDSNNAAKYNSLPSSRPLTRFEKGDQDLRLGMLEEKVKDWLSKANPKSSANVSKLRRLHVEDMDSRPKPGNKIVIRRRRRVRHSDSSSGTATGSSGNSNGRLPVHRINRYDINPTEKYKILIAH